MYHTGAREDARADPADGPTRVLHVDPGGSPEAFAAALRRGDPDHEPVEVVTAARANDAVDHLDDGRVDCVVTEYDLPDVDGVDLLDIVRERDPDLPVVLFTAAADESVVADALAAGATDYVRKDARPDECALLARRVRAAVERRRAERECERLRRQCDLVTTASGEAFWDWNVRTDEVRRNEGYTSEFGYDDDAVGSDLDWWYEAIHPEDRGRVRDAIDRALTDSDAEYDETYRLRMGDGSYRHVRSRGDVVYDRDGDPVRMVGVHVDVTEQVEYERELKRRNQRLDEFVSVVSHDLRNPLGVLRGTLELAAEDADAPDRHLNRALTTVDRMEDMIDDLLVLAREGQTVGDPEPVDLRALAERCWRSVETGEASLRVETDRLISCDPGRTRQLFENVFRNSVEHGSTDDGTGADDAAAVTVTVGDLDGDDGFYVADDGRGIPAAERDRVVESGYTTSRDGTGFGLAIVERVADAHGWTMQITESVDGGARIEFRVA